MSTAPFQPEPARRQPSGEGTSTGFPLVTAAWLLPDEGVANWLVQRARTLVGPDTFEILPHLTLRNGASNGVSADAANLVREVLGGSVTMQTVGLRGDRTPFRSLYLEMAPPAGALQWQSQLAVATGTEGSFEMRPQLKFLGGTLRPERQADLLASLSIPFRTVTFDRICFATVRQEDGWSDPTKWTVTDPVKL